MKKILHYNDIRKKFSDLGDKDLEDLKSQEISMHTETNQLVNTGESVKNVNCYYYKGSFYLKGINHYKLVQPDIATIEYVRDDKIYTIYYDFEANKYSEDENTEVAYDWLETELGKKIPKPDVKVLKQGVGTEDMFSFSAYGFSVEQFNSYVDECKALNYTKEESSHDGYYSAKNEEGYEVSLMLHEKDNILKGSIHAPPN